MDIEWEDPPALALAKVRTPGRYVDFAYALREHPERWAKLPDKEGGEARTDKGAANLAQSIRRGTTAGFKPKGSFEAVADGGTIFVRFTGEPDQAEGQEADPGKDETAEAPGEQAAVEDRQLDPAKVRAWARTNGIGVPDRGRLSEDVIARYAAALERGEHGLGLRAVRGGDPD
jgi:hypothetical protein